MTRRRQIKILLPVGVGLALSLTGDLALYTILPTLALATGLANVGILLSANRLVRFGSNPLAGALVDRWGRRPLLLLGVGLGTLSTLVYALTPGFGLFLASRLVWGISWSLIYISAYCVVLDVTGDDDRGRGSGFLQVFYFAGYIASPFLGGLLNDRFGFSTTMYVCAALSGIGFLTLLLFMPETLRLKAGDTPARTAGHQPGFDLKSALALLKHPQLDAAGYLNFVAMFIGDGLIMSTIGLLAAERYAQGAALPGLTIHATTLAGLLLTLRAVLSALFAPLSGSLADRSSRPWSIIAGSVLLGMLGLTLLISNHAVILLFAGVLLLAFNNGAALTLLPAILGRNTAPRQKGMAMAIFSTAGDLGSALAPLASYLLLGSVPLTTIYILSAVILATALPVAWIYARGELLEARRNDAVVKP